MKDGIHCKRVDVVHTKYVGLERQNYQALDILNSIIVLPDDGDLFFFRFKLHSRFPQFKKTINHIIFGLTWPE